MLERPLSQVVLFAFWMCAAVVVAPTPAIAQVQRVPSIAVKDVVPVADPCVSWDSAYAAFDEAWANYEFRRKALLDLKEEPKNW